MSAPAEINYRALPCGHEAEREVSWLHDITGCLARQWGATSPTAPAPDADEAKDRGEHERCPGCHSWLPSCRCICSGEEDWA